MLHPTSGGNDPNAHQGSGDYGQSWAVGNVHRERQDGYISRKCPALVLNPRAGGAVCAANSDRPGHTIDMDWDDVEMVFLQKMRMRPRSSTHADAHGKANLGHCTRYRWQVLPGSRYPLYNYMSDGVMSRLSMLHCAKQD